MDSVLTFLVEFIEARYPGSKPIIDIVLPYLTDGKLANVLTTVLADIQNGQNFYQILIDVLKADGGLPAPAIAQLDLLKFPVA